MVGRSSALADLRTPRNPWCVPYYFYYFPIISLFLPDSVADHSGPNRRVAGYSGSKIVVSAVFFCPTMSSNQIVAPLFQQFADEKYCSSRSLCSWSGTNL